MLLLFLVSARAGIFAQIPLGSDSAGNNTLSIQEICDVYHENRQWLPDAFIANATCVCNILNHTHTDSVVRVTLASLLQKTPDSVKNKAAEMKSLRNFHKISRHKYKSFVKKNLTKMLYEYHVIAYKKAGCKGDPAPYWEWKIATTRRFSNCHFLWFGVRWFGGSCSGKAGKW